MSQRERRPRERRRLVRDAGKVRTRDSGLEEMNLTSPKAILKFPLESG